MNELSLFAGAGGGILAGVLNGWETVCAVEIEPYCREVLLRRQRDGVLPVFPIWDDIRTFDGRPWRGLVDVVSGGFPCQPFSVAGKRLADDDERNLWPETLRVLGEVRPRYALLENVPGLASHPHFGRIIADLATLGYDAAWGIVGADDVGAPHKRERLWIVAHADRGGGGEDFQPGELRAGLPLESSCDQGTARPGEGGQEPSGGRWWASDPADEAPESVAHVGRVADVVAYRVHRLKALGNGQVPLVAAVAWLVLTDALRGE